MAALEAAPLVIWALLLALSLAIGCSSQKKGDEATADAGPQIDSPTDDGSAISDASICGLIIVGPLSQPDDAAVHACSFSLTTPPALPSDIRVFTDETLTTSIPADSINGWMYSDASTIVLTGRYCDDARAGRIVSLYAVVACPGHPIP